MKCMKTIISYLALCLLASSCCDCNEGKVDNVSQPTVIHDTVIVTVHDTIEVEKSVNTELNEYELIEKLPDWVLELDVLGSTTFLKGYSIENRLNPLYLEADWNGDGHLDLALPIQEVISGKKGIVIIHGNTGETFIIGAGQQHETMDFDELGWVDIWKVNRLKENKPGLEEEIELLVLENPSIRIAQSELGGGLIYWNGEAYSYFHQTC